MEMAIRTTAGAGIAPLLPWVQQQRAPANLKRVQDALGLLYDLLVQTLLPLWQQHPLPVHLLLPHTISCELCHQLLVMLQTEYHLGHGFQWTLLQARCLPTVQPVIWGAVECDAACFMLVDATTSWVPDRLPNNLDQLYVYTMIHDWQADWIKLARKLFKAQLRKVGTLPRPFTLSACLGDVGSVQWPLLLALMQQTKIPLIELTGERQCLMWQTH